MAVTITQADVTIAIRAATDAGAIPAPVATVMGFVFKAATAIVIDYAEGAPDDVHNAATIRLSGWLYDSDPSVPASGNPLRASGAAQLLAPWRVQRAAVVAGPGDELPPIVPAPPNAGTWALIANNGEMSWIEFPIPA